MESDDVKVHKNNTGMHIAVMVFFLVVVVIIIWGVAGSYKIYKTYKNANFIETEATLNRYQEVLHNTYVDYSIYYEFVSPEGKVFTGLWERAVRSEEDAKTMMGQKVPVYYDAELGLCVTTKKYSATGIIIGSILSAICILIFLNSLVREILYIVRLREYKSIMVEESIIDYGNK